MNENDAEKVELRDDDLEQFAAAGGGKRSTARQRGSEVNTLLRSLPNENPSTQRWKL